MARLDWTQDGPRYTRSWGGRPWSIRLDDDSPGLSPTTADAHARLLAVQGAGGQGERARSITPGMLVQHEPIRGGVGATYRLTVGGDVLLRAVWSAVDETGVDLEVEASTRSVGLVQGLSLILGSRWPLSSRVHMLDAPAGEGPLVLMPPSARQTITLATMPGFPGQTYVEMAQPFGLVDEPAEPPGAGSRYRFFGHDLERGVLLRARIRGVWLPGEASVDQAIQRWRQFVATPIHLGV